MHRSLSKWNQDKSLVSTPVGEGFRGPDGRIGYLLRQAHQAMRTAIDQEVRKLGISAPQFSLLSVLRNEPGLSGAELADDSMLTQQTTSEIVRGLERRELVERRNDPLDARSRRIYLTAKGRRVLRAADERVARLEEESVRSLGVEQQAEVQQWLVACAATFSELRPNGRRRRVDA